MPDVYKIKVVKTGYSITDTNIAHVVFDSNINTFKIRSKNTVTLTPANGSYTVTHGLGYAPAVLAWFEVEGDGRWYPSSTKEDISGHGVNLYISSDATYIVVYWYYDSAPSSLKVHYQSIVDPI